MKEKMFEENQWGLLPIMLVAVIVTVCISVISMIFASKDGAEIIPALWIIVPVLLILIFAMIVFAKLSITVDKENLVFGFAPFLARIPLQNITAVRVSSAGIGKTLGLGIRISFDGRYYFNTFWGKVVEIDTTSKNYAISIRDDQGLLKALKTLKPEIF